MKKWTSVKVRKWVAFYWLLGDKIGWKIELAKTLLSPLVSFKGIGFVTSQAPPAVSGSLGLFGN